MESSKIFVVVCIVLIQYTNALNQNHLYLQSPIIKTTLLVPPNRTLSIPSDVPLAQSPLCGNNSFANTSNRDKITGTIRLVLEVISNQNKDEWTPSSAMALAWIKAVDSKHRGKLQQLLPIQDWINKICASFSNSRVRDTCYSAAKVWKPRTTPWKDEILTQEYSAKTMDESRVMQNLDKQKTDCTEALVTACEVSAVCKLIYFSSEPSSQYLLTQQLLMRMFAEHSACLSVQNLIDHNVNQKICAKMYQEAKLIVELDFPSQFRDLFAEQVSLCGYLGYTEFIRQDWLETILSWKATNQYGCSERKNEAVTKSMVEQNDKNPESASPDPKETCTPDLIPLVLMFLSNYWDFLEEICV